MIGSVVESPPVPSRPDSVERLRNIATAPSLQMMSFTITEKGYAMKVCTCLNALHTALAIFGCLLHYTTIWEEIRDDDLRTFVHRLTYDWDRKRHETWAEINACKNRKTSYTE